MMFSCVISPLQRVKIMLAYLPFLCFSSLSLGM